MKYLKVLLFACFALLAAMAFCKCNNNGKSNEEDNSAQGPKVVVKTYHATGYLQEIPQNGNFYYWASDTLITSPASVTDSMWLSSTSEPNLRGFTLISTDTFAISAFINAPNLRAQLNPQ